MRTARTSRAFTIVELLVVVSIIALLVGILLPAVGKARDQAQLSVSQSNLRQLAAAHGSYAAEWADRQFSLCADSLASYGTSASNAITAYQQAQGGQLHAPVYLGWGYTPDGATYGNWRYPMSINGNHGLVVPIVWPGTAGCCEYFGSFRFINAKQFSQYINGRFYDPVFYAPKDTVVVDAVSECFDDPGEFCQRVNVQTDLGDIPAWASYVLSPAAMFNPRVMAHVDPQDDNFNGWVDPFSLGGGLRSPAFSQTLYPNLKSHMLEHHWLQNVPADCNPGFVPGTYAGCEPYYFNHGQESAPITLFYDGHIASIGVREAERADGRITSQTGNPQWGLWNKTTPWGANGYLNNFGYDQANSSFHILTTDGIRGRDRLDT